MIILKRYNATAWTEAGIRKELSIPAGDEIVDSSKDIGGIYLYAEMDVSNRSLVMKIESVVKDAEKNGCECVIISGDSLVYELFERELNKRNIGFAATSDPGFVDRARSMGLL